MSSYSPPRSRIYGSWLGSCPITRQYHRGAPPDYKVGGPQTSRARIAGKPAIEVVFERFNAALSSAGYLAMSGQIIDATIVAAPKQRNTDGEKRDIREGRIPPEWAKRARHDGAVLPELIDRDNTAGEVWADTAYRSQANERFLAGCLLRSQIRRKKPKGKPMPRRTARANARKSAVRSAVEHVFVRQKGPLGLFIRTIGIARARTKIGLVNLLYNMQRMVWLSAQTAPA